MKITNLTSQISFKKTLVANCSVIKKENDSFPCRIFCLDSTNDVDYFETVKNSQDWQKARATYEHLIDLATDDDVIQPLLFLRQRELVHFARFKELYDYYKAK